MKKLISKDKPTHLWVFLIVLPFILLAVTAGAEILVHFALNNSDGSIARGTRTIVNIISVLLGMISVVLIIGIPVWVVMLIKSDKPAQ